MRQIKSFLFLCLIVVGSIEAREPTVQTEYPVPYSYFENLYFDEADATFFSLGAVADPAKVMPEAPKRHYRFEFPETLDPKREEGPSVRLAGTTLILCEEFTMRGCLGHYFHFLEHVVGAWSFLADKNPEAISRIVMVDAGIPEELSEKKWKGPNKLNWHIVQALFPKAEVLTWAQFREKYRGQTVCFEQAMTSDRAVSAKDSECAKVNKMLGAARPCLSAPALERMADRIHAYAKTPARADDGTINVTYVNRFPPRFLDGRAKARLFAKIKAMPGVNLQCVDFAKLSFQEQVNVVGHTDVLIGVHGNGLSHILYLPRGASVIEIFPKDAYHIDYRMFANIRGVDYYGMMAWEGFMSDEEAYENYKYVGGHVNQCIHFIDEEAVIEVIKSKQ